MIEDTYLANKRTLPEAPGIVFEAYFHTQTKAWQPDGFPHSFMLIKEEERP